MPTTLAATLEMVRSAGPLSMLVPTDERHKRQIEREQAITLRQWDALESLGFVRLRSEWDWDFNPSDYDDGVFDDDDEAYGSIGEFRLDADDCTWVVADSCWGHVGYRDVLDWRENCYILDIMAETIAAFKEAWKARVNRLCPVCKGSGRID